MEPRSGELAKHVLDRVDEGALQIAEGEVEGSGVFTNMGANVSSRKNVESVDVDFVVDGGPKGSNERVEDVL